MIIANSTSTQLCMQIEAIMMYMKVGTSDKVQTWQYAGDNGNIQVANKLEKQQLE